jgi:hypothetical protein
MNSRSLDRFGSKLTIINYFDSLINQIDIKTEIELAQLLFSDQDDSQIINKAKESQENVNKIRERFLHEIKNIENFNLQHFHNNEDNNLFRKFCFLIDKSCFKLSEAHGSNSLLDDKKFVLGILIITNEYVDLDELNDFKKLLQLNFDNKHLLGNFFEIGPDVKTVSFSIFYTD